MDTLSLSILRIINNYDPAPTRAQIEEELPDKSRSVIYKKLMALVDNGYITMMHKKKRMYFYLTKEGEREVTTLPTEVSKPNPVPS
jgi:DNA-binding PadR family transcriptional regulator